MPISPIWTFIKTMKTNINTLFGLHNDNAAAISSNDDNIEALNVSLFWLLIKETTVVWLIVCHDVVKFLN